MTKEQKAVSDRIRLSGGFKNFRLEALFRKEKAQTTAMKIRAFFVLYAVVYSCFAVLAPNHELRFAGGALAASQALNLLRLPRKTARLNLLTGFASVLFFGFALFYALFAGGMHPLFYLGLLVPFLLLEMPLKFIAGVTLPPFLAVLLITGTGNAAVGILLFIIGAVYYIVSSYMRRSYFLHQRRENAGAAAHPAQHPAGNGSGKDPLTGLASLGAFLEKAETLLKGSPAENDSFMLVFDIDGFEKINKTHGLETGDMLLKGTAQRLRSIVGSSGITAKTGGGEFAVFLADETEKTAKGMAEKIRVNIENSRWKTPKSEATVTVSAGLALVCPEGTESAADVFYKAREAMFTAKTNGRNRVVFHSTEC
ncbi:MAG: GGDEF domain-containing protein [Deferribacterales bacterium]